MLVQVIEGLVDRFRRALEAADYERTPGAGARHGGRDMVK
jgi:hypothetical protein